MNLLNDVHDFIYLLKNVNSLKFRKWFKYGLKAQKLLAQGIALGIMANSKTPCKGKSFAFMITQGDALGYELLPFQGVWGKSYI